MSEVDLESMPLDDLEKLMSDMAAGRVTAEPVEETPAEPEPSPEPEPEAPREPEVAEPEAPAPEPEPAEDLEKESLKAQLEALALRQKANDEKFGRLGGELDYWRRKATERQAAPQRAPESDSYEEVQEEPQRAPQVDDPTRAWVLEQAVNQGITRFAEQNPETNELIPELMEYLKANGYTDGAIYSRAETPTDIQREAYRVMSEAFWHVRAEKAEARRVEYETKRAEQFSRQKEAKARASISASGSPPAPRQKPVSLNDAPLSDLEAQLNRARPQDFSR